MAGQMAPNDVTSCFNKTLEGSAASLNANKDYYAIHFLPPLSNFLSFSPSVIFNLTPSLYSTKLTTSFIQGNCVCVRVHSSVMLSKLMNTNSAVLMKMWDSEMLCCCRASLLCLLFDI